MLESDEDKQNDNIRRQTDNQNRTLRLCGLQRLFHWKKVFLERGVAPSDVVILGDYLRSLIDEMRNGTNNKRPSRTY